MVTVNLEAISAVLAILVILVGAISSILGIYLKITKSIDNQAKATEIGFTKVNNALTTTNKEISELKGYREDIEQNKEDILRLQETKVDEDKFNDLFTAFTKLETKHDSFHAK